ncbi:hypothetical protein ACJQWK_02079 [Exserohilum turcicum]
MPQQRWPAWLTQRRQKKRRERKERKKKFNDDGGGGDDDGKESVRKIATWRLTMVCWRTHTLTLEHSLTQPSIHPSVRSTSHAIQAACAREQKWDGGGWHTGVLLQCTASKQAN